MLTGGVVAAVVAAMTVPVPGHAVGDHTAACRPDRRVNITRPVEKAYRDPIGDAKGGDITGMWISDLRGVVTFKIDAKNLGDTSLVVNFNTRCSGIENYKLTIWPRGATLLYNVPNGSERHVAVFRRRSHRTVGAITYTFRFSSRQFGGATAFRFDAGVNSPTSPYDTAPHVFWDFFYYDLLSR
jgi:hypothetical protein